MKEKMNLVVMVTVCILFIIMPFAGTMGNNVQKEYEERGIDVEATVTDVVRIRKNRFITVEYVAQNGSVISASASMSRFNVHVGDVFIGKVLPEKPYEVRELPSDTFSVVTNIFFWGMALMGVAGLVLLVRAFKQNNRFRKEGIYAQARVIDYKMDGNYYVEILAFYTKEGVYFRVDNFLAEGSPQVGRTYTIQYLPSDPNKIQILY